MAEAVCPATNPENSPARPGGAGACGWSGRDYGYAFGLLVILLVAYFPALRGGFIWNDDDYVTKPALRSLAGLGRIWAEPGATEQYYPVLHSFFWFEHRLWGDAPFGYHLANVWLHGVAAVLIARIFRQLALPGGWLAALLFALHPVCVESVAWVSEQKNTLSTVFFLAALLVWLRFDERRTAGRYRLGLGLFLLALGSKSLTATLPPALLVIAWWRRGRLEWRRDVLPLLPWFVVGALFGLFTAWVERKLLVAEGEAFALTLADRLTVATHAIWFYLGKLAWPADLVFIYPRWDFSGGLAWRVAPAIGLAVLLVGLFSIRRTSRAPLAAFLLFAGTLFPVLGFFNLYAFIYSFVADHWQYLSCIAIIALAAGAAGARFASAGLFGRRLIGTGAGVVLALCFVLTYRQCGMYRDIVTFYRVTIEKNPACWMAYNNLGNELAARGQAAEALRDYRRAVELNPRFAIGFCNVGVALLDAGRAADAVAPLQHSLALDPGSARSHYNLANAWSALGQPEKAVHELREALLCAPQFPSAETNLGVALARLGRTGEAVAHYERAVRENPADATALYNLGNAALAQGRLPEAMADYEQALRVKPDLAEAHVNGAVALGRLGRPAEAIAHLEAALALNPRLAEAHLILAGALREQGKIDEARRHADLAHQLNPQLPEMKF